MNRTALVLVGIGALLLAERAWAAVDPGALCAERKMKAAGQKAFDLFKAYGKNTKVPNPSTLERDISKAQSRFTKRFANAEFSGSGEPRGCVTEGDAATIEAMVDDFVVRQLAIIRSGPASAKQITDASECVGGPLARCRVGDYLLENGEIRVVIQSVQRNLMGIGQFGGQIIDADLRRQAGDPERDNFGEWATAINVENAAHYIDITIINDGSDCEAAVIRATGPDDMLDWLNPSSVVSSFGFDMPSALDDTDLPVEFSTDYILDPGKNWVRVETTVTNTGGTVVSTYFGEFLNGSGQIDLFQPGYGFGETLVTTACPSTATNPCDAVVYRGVDKAAGVSYGYVHEDTGTEPFTGSTAFTAAGITVPILGREIALVLIGAELGAPNFVLQPSGNPGDSVTKTRYFIVGDGTVSSILDARNTIKGIATGTLSGRVRSGSGPVAGADVAVIGVTAEGPSNLGGLTRNVVNHTETDASGRYALTLPPGSYNVVANRDGHPYQGNGATPALNPVAITAAATTSLDITLPDAGELQVTVTDGGGSPIPAKTSVVGFDPSPAFGNSQSVVGLIQNRTAVFREVDQDGLLFGVAQVLFIEPTGVSDTILLEPGEYEVVVSRGPEYSIAAAPITVDAKKLSSVSAKLARVIDTSGFVGSDFHVHSIYSHDSEVTERERIITMMSEGLEFFTPSDHEARRDFQPTIVAEGWEGLVTTAPNAEITTFDYGHFNAWPMTIDPNQVNGGTVDHGGAAPAGQDFPSFGHYNLTPAEVIAAADADPGPDTVQINHISSHFGLDVGGTDLGSGLAIDTGLEPPMSVVQPSTRRLDPTKDLPTTGYFTNTFDALEIWIGDSRGQIFDNFLGQNAGDWFNLLNQGIVRTGIADSDTHNRIINVSGVPRTMVASAVEDLTLLDPETMSGAVNAGRAIGTNAPMVRVTLEALTSGLTASLEAGGSTLVAAADGKVAVTVDVQSPAWAEFDTVEFYVNSTTQQRILEDLSSGPGQLVDVARYGIAPDVVHTAGAEFTVSLNPGLDPQVPGSDRLEASTTLTLDGVSNPTLTEDTWIVVMVKGTDGVSKPLFPVVPNSLKTSTNTSLEDLTDGNLGEDGILALAFTNPLFVDVDNGAAGGPDGNYDPPGVRCTSTVSHPSCVTMP